MNNARICLSLLVAVLCTGCAERTLRTDSTHEMDRRRCMTQPPAQMENCMRRVEDEHVARQGMDKLKRDRVQDREGGAVVEEAPR